MMQKTTKKKSDHYNNSTYNYLHYWDGRDYEHAAEEAAIERFLNGRHVSHAVDVGGGYGRLCVLLEKYANTVTLTEPSKRQLDIAQKFLMNHPGISRKLAQAGDLPFKDSSVDLITMIRVLHHLPDPRNEFAEIARILSGEGLLILEMANVTHLLNRIKYFVKGKKMPVGPVDIRSEKNKREEEIPFVNHNPETIIQQLAGAGLKVEKVLSVSNVRSPALKKVVPTDVMLFIEKLLQPALARIYFGPSIFFLVRKASH